MADYFKQRERDVNLRLREIRDTLPEFCEEFFVGVEPQTTVLTRLGYAYDLRIFFDYLIKRVRAFKGMTTDELTLSDMEKVTVTHLENYMEYLTLYEFDGKEFGNGDRGKARKISLPKQREKEIIRLERHEIEKILNTAEDGEGMSAHQRKILLNTRARDVAILSLLLGTGIRVSECVGLNVKDIDFETNAFTVTRKGGSRAILYFNNDVKEALEYYIEGERKALLSRTQKVEIEDPDALFLSLQVRRICVRAVENLVKKYAAVAAPLKKISPHKLRSTYGTNLYRATGDIYMVADVLGHRDVNTTKKHYAAIEQDHRKAAAKAVTLRDGDDV